MTGTSPADQVYGTFLVVGAAMVFALVALVVKLDSLPLLPATECRYIVAWGVAVLFMLLYQHSRGLFWFGPPGLRKLLVLKSAVSFGFITLWWASLRRAPLGDSIAIIYCSPILVSIWSLLLLGEPLHVEFPFQVILNMVGIVLVVNPPFLQMGASSTMPESAKPDYSLVFAALLLCSFAPIVTRWTRDCSWIEVEHVNALLACVVFNPTCLYTQFLMEGVKPQWGDGLVPQEAVLILLASLGSFIGIAMETKGYQIADPGKASMYRYVEVPFAYVLQSVGTDAPLETRAILGSLLILASCALSAAAERFRTKSHTSNESAKALLEEDSKQDADMGA